MNILDTRDLNTRLEELEDELEGLEEALADAQEELEALDEDDDRTEAFEAVADALDALQTFLTDDGLQDELKELRELRDEIPEWQHGEALVPVDDWEEYVQELLEDCGTLPKDLPWYVVIDWTATAENIAQDYSTIDYQGETYYFRNC